MERKFPKFLRRYGTFFFENAELDRIDNDKDYSPENCRWVTHSHNMLNRKGFKNKTKYPGIKKSKKKYFGRVQINKNLLYQIYEYP